MVSYRKHADRLPKLTRHKASGQGVVRIDGKDVYCGPYNTPECRSRYLRVLAEWEAARHREEEVRAAGPPGHPEPESTADLTINEFLLAYRRYADGCAPRRCERTTSGVSLNTMLRER